MASRSSQGPRAGKQASKAGRKRRHQTTQGHDFYVQHTDKDVMFVIHDPFETVTVVKRRVEDSGPPVTTDSGWGSVMPHEIIHSIFQLLVDEEGAVPILCRLARVCRLWRQVAYSPDLWQRVLVSRCWSVPNVKDPARLKNKIKSTIEGVIQERLSQVSDFSLHHWAYHVPLVLQSLSSSCPLLTSLTLSHCSKVQAADLVSVGERCPLLTTFNLQGSQVVGTAVSRFLEVRGSSLRSLYLSFSCQTSNIINLLASGSCPELRFLEVNRDLNIRTAEVHVYAEGLQASCPKLEVLRLLNVIFSLKSKPSSSPQGPGFSQLHELCLATSTFCLLNDSILKILLRDCTQLRVLDLRGCYRITPECIAELPCPDIERLYLGMYGCTTNTLLPYDGCFLMTRRWRHSLQELDLASQHFSESDLSQALGILSGGGTNNTLQSLSLTGTRVTAAAVRDVLTNCQALTHLDLSSCRNIPRGLKRGYRSRENIRQCRQMLCIKMLEESNE